MCCRYLSIRELVKVLKLPIRDSTDDLSGADIEVICTKAGLPLRSETG